MRTLLIDNHDSFTYNLFHYLATCNGHEPFVARNDEITWDEIESLDFDNIVISPGPGRPQRHADLGVSVDVLRHAEVPVLGVCLGHQAIAHHCGATVDLAVRPMHGRIDSVSHDGRDLFRGIPDSFNVVRYHSLAVRRLPPHLEGLAWAPDGTLMALRHAHKPWWGVQFHPESICTEFGARLLRNFRDLTEQWQHGGATHDPAPDLRPWSMARQDGAQAIHARCHDDYPDPEAIFSQRFATSAEAFWLDSSLIEHPGARFSYMGDASGPGSEVISYESRAQRLEIRRGADIELRTQSVFDYLDERIQGRAPSGPALPFEFKAGYVGYFGYELKGELDGEHAHDAPTPDAIWILADRFVVFDHAEQQTWTVCLDGDALSDENRAWMHETQRLLAACAPCEANDAGARPSWLSNPAWQIDLPRYRELIVQCQEEILQGESYELCLTNKLVASGHADTLAVYQRLRARNPAPYAAYLRTPALAVLSASPELFLQISAGGQVETKPIKGTSRRGATTAEDEELATRLADDEKSRAENLMIVDLLRNDLGRVCEVGSVHVPALFHIESYKTVHQLVSTIRGKLRAGRTAIDCIRHAFPGGSMTGAPKRRSMKILDRLEPAARGIYSGSIGYLSLDGAARLNIVIRTIVCADGKVSIGSGGAIIALSNPDDEVEEMVLKAAAQLDALGLRDHG
ncbi:aminodeoxychorismate synthase component I [Variovorax saccharolyticus]|uniref:aminodeoxychorismate synthase component I n=1 Tax=Variovorax saccharolyticus TaxID=3053516 RepID=UPI002577607E|nr:aminodeoxychorismate synthase component I [Variovorax sp. J31P216]MDM0025723.1 aminodeoxychorismate synthase component I [Variovorax sp. J31P216]